MGTSTFAYSIVNVRGAAVVAIAARRCCWGCSVCLRVKCAGRRGDDEEVASPPLASSVGHALHRNWRFQSAAMEMESDEDLRGLQQELLEIMDKRAKAHAKVFLDAYEKQTTEKVEKAYQRLQHWRSRPVLSAPRDREPTAWTDDLPDQLVWVAINSAD